MEQLFAIGVALGLHFSFQSRVVRTELFVLGPAQPLCSFLVAISIVLYILPTCSILSLGVLFFKETCLLLLSLSLLFLLGRGCLLAGFFLLCRSFFLRGLRFGRSTFKQFVFQGPEWVIEKFPDVILLLSDIDQDPAFLHEPLLVNFFVAEAQQHEIEYCRFEVFLVEVVLELFLHSPHVGEGELAILDAVGNELVSQPGQLALQVDIGVQHVHEDGLQLGGADVGAKVIVLHDVEEESARVDMLQIDVLVVFDEDFFEEGDELALADLAVERQVRQLVEPFIQGIHRHGLLGLVLLVIFELRCQDIQYDVNFFVDFLLQAFERAILFDVCEKDIDGLVFHIEVFALEETQ